MGARPKYFEQVNRQRSITEYIPYSSHLTPDTIITREGDLLRIWKVSGIPFETVDPEDVVLRKEQLNTMLRSVGSQNVALWTHTLRRRTSDRLDGVFENDFCRDFNKKYFDSFTGYRMMANELYLTLVYRPTPTRMERSLLRASRRTVEERLKDQKAALSKLAEAIDQLLQGEFSMGEYHYSLMIFADSIEEVTSHRASAMAKIQDMGFVAALINTATDAAYFAQLPANWTYRPRIAGLTTRNFAGLASFHNFSSGKRNGNPWGEAVTMFKTDSGQPLYFNFHYSKGDEDDFDKKLLGNTRIIGQSGAGKTVLLNVMLAQLQKYQHGAPNGFATVFFDKDHGAELFIRAIGGKYLAIKNGQPTGLNPFQMDATEENILFLERMVRVLVSGEHQRVTTTDEHRISQAVRTVMRMPKVIRRLSLVTQNMTEGKDKEDRENSVVKRLQRWCEGGPLGWVLDNPVDHIDFTTHVNYGFDGTDFLDNPDVRTPISMYLLHRMESVIDGRRFSYFMDEAWKWVDDEAFAEFAGNKQLTIRKQNGFGVFSTQMPSSLLKSKIASALVQQVATEVYLPNPKADFDEYTRGFKVSEAEFEYIRAMGEESRMFLIKQGNQSMIGRLDLRGFDDELAIFSGSLDNVELLHEIMNEVGEDPKDWMPIFHERRKARKSVSQSA